MVLKVSTALREIPEAKEKDLPDIDVEDVIDPDVAHRGRRRYSDTRHIPNFQLITSTGSAKLCMIT